MRSSIEDVVLGRRRSAVLEFLLLLCSFPYRMLVSARLALFRMNVLKTRTLPCRVISVGNMTLGGTGKTPTVIQIAELLKQSGSRPVVLSRGYGRENAQEIVVVSDGKAVLCDARRGGDEPVLLAARLRDIPVIVGSDRFAAGMLAMERFHPDVVVLDDGFQHLRLKRDLNIVLLNAQNPAGNGKLFPAGILREPLKALGRADAVLITGAETDSMENVKALARKFTSAPIFTSHHEPVSLVDLRDGSKNDPEALKDRSIMAFSGIARPASFFSLLRKLGADVRREITYPDHHAYTEADIDDIRQQAREANAELIVTTEKDAVKLRGMQAKGIKSLVIEQRVREEREWEQLLLGEK